MLTEDANRQACVAALEAVILLCDMRPICGAVHLPGVAVNGADAEASIGASIANAVVRATLNGHIAFFMRPGRQRLFDLIAGRTALAETVGGGDAA